MARAQDSSGYPNSQRPPAGQAFTGQNPYTGQQYQINRQYARGQQGDTRQMRPRTSGTNLPAGAATDIMRRSRARLPRNAQGRVNIYGSSNPYQTTTQPYEGIAWLGSGFPHPLPQVPRDAPLAPSFDPIQPGAARPTWDLAGIASLLGPWFHVPIKEDYNLNLKLREAIPLIDAAILRLKDLVGFPEIEAAPRLKADIDNFLRNLPVNRIQQGGETWARSHLDNAYTFGRAHAEIILTYDRKDVFGLVEVHPTTTGLRPTFDGYAVNVVQYQFGGGVPITLVPELLLTSVNDFRGDDPNGNSLIASIPFVGEILIKMFRSMGQTWERFGTPNYHVNWEPPDDWNDPTGDQTTAILSPMMQNLYQSDLDRANGRIRHFWTTGKVGLSVMGADGHTLEFEHTAKEFAQQITAKTGIPPFMLGLSWSTTERMSTAQAKLLTEVIEAGRAMLEPPLMQLITLRQRLVGRSGKVALKWPRVSLQDLETEARAAWMNAQADSIKLENLKDMSKLGIYSMPEIAQQLRPDLEGLQPDEIKKRLNGENGAPKLLDEVPDEMANFGPVRGVHAGPHGSGKFGRDQAAGNLNPADQATRALIDGEMKELVTNGNGNGRH